MQNSVIELVTFRCKDGVSQDAMTKTANAMEAFLHSQNGFIYRSLSRDEDDVWHDIIYWQTQEAAKQAGENFMRDAQCQDMMAHIDPKSVRMRHMQACSEIISCES
ncbi:hypothetical protein [Pseudoteredinibacter isoporae]|uniref:ABM domain-containing protein n=1 Tax=Pseudoteredinibacter isoporae TaxID=570281 RepID=A0A7X0JSA6_9GAMM|nr:hypothetical protein [Pseudoteredinibacter isoporae]MBB6521375.1 hypothetical protein [Pseudoteredinibacter isoporae]NHO86930.1 hypothetical protein [Pseudoteredinibacter isoporae]NIB24617.1 hypothetical protein [Pseudoteredinibacter isoporae]